MLSLKKIEIKNFMSFVGNHVIEFDSNIMQIDGDSGAGKSNIIKAVDYLFGNNSLPIAKMQSWMTEDPFEITGYFNINGEDVVISRNKNSGLKISTYSQTWSNNSKVTEEVLNKLINLPPKIFHKIYHKQQDSKGFFINLKPKECYLFLSEVLGLDNLIEKQNKIDLIIKQFEQDIKDLALENEKDVQYLNNLDSLIDQTKKSFPEKIHNDQELEQVTSEIEKTQKLLNNLKKQHEIEIASVVKEETIRSTLELLTHQESLNSFQSSWQEQSLQ